MEEVPVIIKSGELALEGRLALPASGRATPGVVVCHPHPAYGGSMDNNVVEAILAAMWRLGYATLRFNFRGVGESEGEYDGGEGEGADAIAAVDFLARQASVDRAKLILGGYSFGASIALSEGLADQRIAQIVAVALPIAAIPLRIEIAANRPVWLFSGDRDSYSPISGLTELIKTLGKSAALTTIAGADHFFSGMEETLAGAIASALAGV